MNRASGIYHRAPLVHRQEHVNFNYVLLKNMLFTYEVKVINKLKKESIECTLDRFNVHRCPTRRVFSGTGLDPVTKQATVRYLYHSATAATALCRRSMVIDGVASGEKRLSGGVTSSRRGAGC
ncbi:hypothetical protein TNCV_4784051 [Trichonephila clavipes]|nr:hypothetical protein TNCV_4784051 [Trichonephila clavipes]